MQHLQCVSEMPPACSAAELRPACSSVNAANSPPGLFRSDRILLVSWINLLKLAHRAAEPKLWGAPPLTQPPHWSPSRLHCASMR